MVSVLRCRLLPGAGAVAALMTLPRSLAVSARHRVASSRECCSSSPSPDLLPNKFHCGCKLIPLASYNPVANIEYQQLHGFHGQRRNVCIEIGMRAMVEERWSIAS